MRQRIQEKANRFSVFWKILLANLLLGISVIFILAVVFIPMMINAAHKNDQAYEENLLHAMRTVVDEVERSAENIVTAVENTEWFHDLFISYVLNDKPLPAGQKELITTELSVLNAKHSEVGYLMVRYDQKQETLLTSGGFFENISFYQNQEPTAINYVFFPQEDGEAGFDTVTFCDTDYLIYRSRLQDLPGSRDKGELNLIYRTEVLRQRLYSAGNGDAAVFRILNSCGEVLWECCLQEETEELATVSLTQTKDGYIYEIDVPMSVHMQTTRQIHWLSFLAIVADLAICIIFAIYLSKQNYRPFGILVKQYASVEPMQNNELVSLSRVMDGLLQEKEQTKHVIDYLRPLARQRIIRGLLNGSVVLDEIPAVQREYCSLEFDQPLYNVIAVQFPAVGPDSNLEGAEFVMEVLVERWSRGANLGAYLYYDDSDHYKIIINYSENCQVSTAVSLLAESCNAYFDKYCEDKAITVGVGSEVMSSNEIHRAAVQAETAVSYGSLMENRPVFYYTEIHSQISGDYYYPFSDEMMLSRAINDGNAESAKNILWEIITTNQNQHGEGTEANKFLYSDLISTIRRTVQNLGLPTDNLKDRAVWNNYSLQEINHLVTVLVEECCERILNCRTAKESATNQRIFDYVEKNLCEPDLSLAKVAEEFGKSSSYVSMIFKQQKDIGYSDYVNQRRIQKAADLLLYDGMSIEAASQAVGYLNLVTFRRNFQKFTKCNPSEFVDSNTKRMQRS